MSTDTIETPDEAHRKHPAKEWQNRLLWHDRSDQSEAIQVIDLLHDIRFLLFIIMILVMLAG